MRPCSLISAALSIRNPKNEIIRTPSVYALFYAFLYARIKGRKRIPGSRNIENQTANAGICPLAFIQYRAAAMTKRQNIENHQMFQWDCGELSGQ